jgi:hypothetical protein
MSNKEFRTADVKKDSTSKFDIPSSIFCGSNNSNDSLTTPTASELL